jgi:WD40 repeat protein
LKYHRAKSANSSLCRFWEALSGICSRTIQHPDSQVNRLCISPDKRFLAAAGHHSVKLYDIKSTNPNPLLTFEGHTNNVTGVAFHCEGKWMVTSSEDGTVKIWETRSGTIQRSYSHGSPVNDVVIHPNQGEIISCDRGGSVRIWDLAENNCSHQLIPEEEVSVSSVTVASDGSTLCAGSNSVRLQVVPKNRWNWLTCLPGKRLCLASRPISRENHSRPNHPFQSPYAIYYTSPAIPRRQASCNLQRRSYSEDLGGQRS